MNKHITRQSYRPIYMLVAKDRPDRERKLERKLRREGSPTPKPLLVYGYRLPIIKETIDYGAAQARLGLSASNFFPRGAGLLHLGGVQTRCEAFQPCPSAGSLCDQLRGAHILKSKAHMLIKKR
jgi:hypothetical protein